MVTTYASYLGVTRDMAKSLARVGKQPVVARESANYLADIVKVKSIDDFMKNDRVYRFALKAYGLEDMTYAKAFIRKILEGGVDGDDTLANKLTDTRYKEFAEAFNFKQYGATATVFTSAQQGAVDRYVRQTLEETAGEKDEGVRLALYFQRKIGSVEDMYGVLADKGLAKVMRTALGLPDAFAMADIDRQAAFFKSKVDLDDLKDAADPAPLKKFLARFAGMWEAANSSAASSAPVTILTSQPTASGISSDLMMTLQRMRLGGS